jgi:hypothetical protein
MVELTGALRAEVQRMRHRAGGSADPIRIARRQDGQLGLAFDTLRDDDVVIDAGAGSPDVVMVRALAEQLEGAIVHFRDTADNRYGVAGMVLLRHRPGVPRGAWVAPLAATASVRTPLWARVRRLGAARQQPSATQTAGL